MQNQQVPTEQVSRWREALDLIWHIAPLPTQSETLRLERIHDVARKALFPREPQTNERYELLDEIGRLRAALKEISEHGYNVENDDAWPLKQIARKALASSPTTSMAVKPSR